MIALSTVGLDRPKLRRTALFVVDIGFAVIAATVLAEWRMALVGGITAMALSFADDDGPLSARLAMLAMVAAGAAAGGIAGHLLGTSSKLFWPLFLAAAFAAGWLYRAGRGPQLTARLFAVALSIIAGLPTVTGSELGFMGAVVAVCLASRVIDHLLFGPLPRDAGAKAAGPASNAQWLQFALAYAAAAGLGLWIGMTLDPARAIWVSTTTLVVMQADGGANYRRIVGRIAGTFAGVIAAMLLTQVLRTPAALCAGMVVTAAFIPHYVRSRYWLHSALIALLVLLAYALATAAGSGNPNMSILFVDRLIDVSLGAILALVGTAIAFPHRVDAADGDETGSPP
jgi:Fusaric acid resistance protein-like